ncbi:MAG: hypothetical protein NTZ60_11595 [Campylobacterales bacterium]|nr:hypothetical protein [Campylobacterales bacterium]
MRLNAGGLSTLIIGRNIEKTTLKTYIELGQHTAIIAPRRYGKTTLIDALLEDVKKEYLIIKVDVFSAASIREFCYLLIDAVYHSIGIVGFIKDAKDNVMDMLSRLNIEASEIKLGFDLLREADDNELVKKTLTFTEEFAQKHDKKAIVFFDEFGDLIKFGDDFIKKMRSYFQKHKQVVYIFAGSQHSVMNGIFLNKENAFFNFASLMELDVLKGEEVSEFLKDLEINGVALLDEAKNSIATISKNHPFYLIKLVQEAYIAALLSQKNIIDLVCVESAIKKIMADNWAFFESEWRKLNSKKYKGLLFKELCGIDIGDLNGASSSYKSQIIKELMNESIINKEKKVTDPFLELWVVTQS